MMYGMDDDDNLAMKYFLYKYTRWRFPFAKLELYDIVREEKCKSLLE